MVSKQKWAFRENPIFRSVVFFFTYTYFPVWYIILTTLVLSWREIAKLTAKLFKPGLNRILSPESGFVCVDSFYEDPKHNLVTIIFCEGDTIPKKEEVRRRILNVVESGQFPELREKLGRWMGFFFWERCDDFDPHCHISVLNQKNFSEMPVIEEKLLAKPWIEGKPLWEIVFISIIKEHKEKNERFVLAFRVHHILTDLTGLTNFASAVADNAENPLHIPISSMYKNNTQESISTKFFKLFKSFGLLHKFTMSFYADFESNAWVNKKKEEMSQESYFFKSQEGLDLDLVKEAAKKHKVTISEILMAGLTMAIREQMLEQRDEVPTKISNMLALPRPGHSGGLTNHAILSTIKLPVGESDPEKRLTLISQELSGKKDMAQLFLAIGVFIGLLQQIIRYVPQIPFCSMASTIFATGREPRYFFGAKATSYGVEIQLSEHAAMASTFFGYAGKISVWIKARKDILKREEAAEEMVKRVIKHVKELAGQDINLL